MKNTINKKLITLMFLLTPLMSLAQQPCPQPTCTEKSTTSSISEGRVPFYTSLLFEEMQKGDTIEFDTFDEKQNLLLKSKDIESFEFQGEDNHRHYSDAKSLTQPFCIVGTVNRFLGAEGSSSGNDPGSRLKTFKVVERSMTPYSLPIIYVEGMGRRLALQCGQKEYKCSNGECDELIRWGFDRVFPTHNQIRQAFKADTGTIYNQAQRKKLPQYVYLNGEGYWTK